MNQFQIGYLKSIRLYELEKVLSIICEEKGVNSNIKILEIGAGAGWQAKKMSEYGYSVEAIDIAKSNYLEQRVWTVKNYDGKNIPFVDYSFDVVFSSSVLEHIYNLQEFQQEIKRVLKKDGIAIHVVPGTAWRFWTSMTHYPFLIKKIGTLTYRVIFSSHTNHPKKDTVESKQIPKKELLKRVVIPYRHGERGNSFSELYYFSKKYWSSLFENTEWKIKKTYQNELFYTGHMFSGVLLPISARKHLSFLLGNVCHIFLLVKNE